MLNLTYRLFIPRNASWWGRCSFLKWQDRKCAPSNWHFLSLWSSKSLFVNLKLARCYLHRGKYTSPSWWVACLKSTIFHCLWSSVKGSPCFSEYYLLTYLYVMWLCEFEEKQCVTNLKKAQSSLWLTITRSFSINSFFLFLLRRAERVNFVKDFF